jgi:hypothetical protein
LIIVERPAEKSLTPHRLCKTQSYNHPLWYLDSDYAIARWQQLGSIYMALKDTVPPTSGLLIEAPASDEDRLELAGLAGKTNVCLLAGRQHGLLARRPIRLATKAIWPDRSPKLNPRKGSDAASCGS